MTTDRQKNILVFHCDSCDDEHEADTYDFHATWSALKKAGWSAVRHKDGSWEHLCPSCRKQLRVS